MVERAEQSNKRKKILIVDGHPVIAVGIAAFVGQEPDLTVCSTVQDMHGALAAIKESCPDVAVVDVFLRDSNGLDLIKDIRTHWPELPVVVFSTYDESFFAERALRAGARGYISKRETPEKFLEAIRKVLNGEIYVGERTTSEILRKFVMGRGTGKSTIDGLTDREFEVLHFIGEGMETRTIAKKLHLSVKTIETHREHIKKKLSLESAAKLAKYAIQWVYMEKIA